jgi:O-antigen/teichoic acid export membrane protein
VYLLDIATSLGGMSESTPAAAATPSSKPPVTGQGKSEGKTEKVVPRGSSTSLLFTIAIVLSSVVFALPVTVAKITEGILDSTNPDHIKDTGAGLAYLGPILGWGFGSLAVLLLIVIVVYVVIYRRERTLDALRLPLLLITIQILLGVIAIIFNAFTNSGR